MIKPGFAVIAAIALAGCATSNLPSKAQLVGGGLMIEWVAPADGTAILIERRSGRIVTTASLEDGDTFSFYKDVAGVNDLLRSMFGVPDPEDDGDFPTVPRNTRFELYFVPSPNKAD
jgi:hypothetical protein